MYRARWRRRGEVCMTMECDAAVKGQVRLMFIIFVFSEMPSGKKEGESFLRLAPEGEPRMEPGFSRWRASCLGDPRSPRSKNTAGAGEVDNTLISSVRIRKFHISKAIFVDFIFFPFGFSFFSFLPSAKIRLKRLFHQVVGSMNRVHRVRVPCSSAEKRKPPRGFPGRFLFFASLLCLHSVCV